MSYNVIMKFINHAKEGFLNLLTSKLRSLLALLGILVGTASVVAMVNGGELATNEALKQFKTLGTDLLAISFSEILENNSTQHNDENLNLSDIIEMKIVSPDIRDVAPYTQTYGIIQFNSNPLNGSVLGVTDSFARIIHLDVEGRFISFVDEYALFCVIGHKLDEKIRSFTFKNSIGQQIQLGKNIFTIVGVAKPWRENSFVYTNIDDAMMIPIKTSMALNKYAKINNLIVRLGPQSNIQNVKQKLTDYFHPLLPNKHLFFRSAEELIAGMTKQSQILTIFLGLIGSVSLVVGGIGVMNIMLVSVVERRREIGIRLAVGATSSDISILFLTEALILSFMGGLLGILIGILISYMMAHFWHWEFIFFAWPPLIGFTVSVATGVFFGFYPAYLAAKLDPINALRAD